MCPQLLLENGTTAAFCYSMLLLTVSLGCSGSDRPALARVHGVIEENGVPLQGVGVVFTPSAAMSGPATGTSGPDGSYQLMYLDGSNGAPLGECRVTFLMESVVRSEQPKTLPAAGAGDTDSEKTARPKQSAPSAAPASLPKDSSMRTVVTGDNTFDFDLGTTQSN